MQDAWREDQTKETEVRKAFIVATWSSIVGALLACEAQPPPQNPPGTENAEAADVEAVNVEAVMEQARELEAETYAPGLYGAAAAELEKGDGREAFSQNEGSAENLARRALDEAIRVREEARLAADQEIRTARILLTVVDAVLSHHPPDRYTLPSDSELSELRMELARAQDAFDAGDFVKAGLIAQEVSSVLTGSPT